MMAIQVREQKEYELFDLAQTNHADDPTCWRKAFMGSVSVRKKRVIVTIRAKLA